MSKEIKKESFETKIEEAQKLLEKLLDPEITLSKSVEVYKNGIKELEDAQKLLEEAKLEFKELSI
ncbi:MAG: exodeoxyribonuclease VII small subunit [Arcobacter sp.]|nr:MAG: exodeoxyribonuclease VII small subunit [Arcobacter sp.]